MDERRRVLPETGGPVAYRAGRAVSRMEFCADVAAARRALARLHPGNAGGRPGFALHEPDACRFAVWLLAGWSLGLTVALPGDDLPVTREALPMPWVGAGNAENALASWAGETGEDPVIDHGCPGVMSYTSGSTGTPSLIGKSLSQLRAEADMLERSFGGELTPETRFVASVPHQHMYGLPFFLFWPLAAGRPFVVEKLRYPEDAGRLPPADYALVSAPTFLRHLPDAPRSSGVRWRMATSAGSPLAPEAACAASEHLCAPLHEIYGSTETGAVARRTVGQPWQPMPGVRLALEEGSSRLLIHSPLLPESERMSGFLSGDLARLDERGLELLGRADRLVKIGEKRISPDQVERELARLPEVAEARVLPLPGAQGERLILAAVVILGPEGRRKLTAEKKIRFNARLRSRLADRLDPLAMPRRWRYVENFPANEMGKTTQGDLERLFAPEFPRAEEIPGAVEDGVALLLRMPADLVWFEGHFPDLPVLPGVVQIDWAAHYGRVYFGFDATASNVSRLKFQNLIRPGDSPRLELSRRRGGSELEFRYILDGKPCSRGIFAPRKPAAAP
ncbi:MAG: AMP-binding protein [Candidatus Accumulibacter sp.]|jgi:acyl-CoA synthetase (AMP-forming)/AMP-acid ligase II|nr:AMP-binding protein [Accumulibacter sp.]